MLTLAILGCGSRGRTYAKIAAAFPDRYQLVAGADPLESHRAAVARQASGEFRHFASDDELFAAGKVADVLIISTQDRDHFRHASAALALGYDILLEKPAGRTLEECMELDRLAKHHGRRILLCFVLRYTPFYRAVKAVIDSGRLGKVMTIRASEGVEPFHQAHSFVRGHWAKTEESTPMIVAKCSHDTDLLCWLTGSAPRSVSSYGRISWFHEGRAPEGAKARCTDDCPHVGNCLFDAHRYVEENRRWLEMVSAGASEWTPDQVLEFLRTSPWGRCVYHCDNSAVDHQILAVDFADGITATLTMSAFDYGRSIEIDGTRASLKGGLPWQQAGAPELSIRDHRTGKYEEVPIERADDQGYAGHGGGDYGILDQLDQMLIGPKAAKPGLDGLHGHWLAFAAEESRITAGQPQELVEA